MERESFPMQNSDCWIDFDTMEQFMVDVFTAIGVPAEDAAVCADVLITADKRGIDSHGVGRLKTIYYDRIVHHKIQQPVTEFEVVRERPGTAVVDGHHGMGMIIATRCMQMAIDIESFTDLDAFRKATGDILRALRASRKAPGAERIYTCGEKEHLAWLERKDKGVPINTELQKQILSMRDELGLTQYRFPFE